LVNWREYSHWLACDWSTGENILIGWPVIGQPERIFSLSGLVIGQLERIFSFSGLVIGQSERIFSLFGL
jgi:hypothetical protein